MDWEHVFDWVRKEPGATEALLNRFVSELMQPISAAEIELITRSQQNPFPPSDPLHGAYHPFDPTAWLIPIHPLPSSYLSFLRWSDGGEFRKGEREFGMFPTLCPGRGVRSMLLAYHLPQYMPGAMPFAFNGGGVFYLFDLRRPPVRGEYPVVAASAGYLGWKPDAWRLVADSFTAACCGTSNIEDLWQ